MTRFARLAAAALFMSAVAVAAGPMPSACAGEGPEATLVVDTGNSVQRLCVALDLEQVSGIRVIELAAEQHGLSYSLGYQGQAVCMLAGVGSGEEECFHGGEPFWGYWRQSSSGGWTWSGTGAGGTTVSDGDVEGWAWGTGNDASSHQQPPATTHASVCGADEEGPGEDRRPPKDDRNNAGGSGPDRPEKDDGKRAEGSDDNVAGGDLASDPDGGTNTAARSGTEGGGQDKKKDRDDRKEDGERKERSEPEDGTPTSVPSAPPTIEPSGSPIAAPGSAGDPGGPPAAGIAALLAAVALGLAGAWFLKRKHSPAR